MSRQGLSPLDPLGLDSLGADLWRIIQRGRRGMDELATFLFNQANSLRLLLGVGNDTEFDTVYVVYGQEALTAIEGMGSHELDPVLAVIEALRQKIIAYFGCWIGNSCRRFQYVFGGYFSKS